MEDLPLGQRVRKIRRSKDLTQKQLGALAGINPITISRVEHGNSDHVYARTVRDLARTLGVSTDYLLGLQEEPTHGSR